MKIGKMTVKRESKAIYTVNGERIDIRQKVDGPVKFKGPRQAINLYLRGQNPDTYWNDIDKVVCEVMNDNLKAFDALEYQIINIH